MKKSIKKIKPQVCKNCYGKGYRTEFKGIDGATDFGNDGFGIVPHIVMEFCNCERAGDLKKYFTIKKPYAS